MWNSSRKTRARRRGLRRYWLSGVLCVLTWLAAPARAQTAQGFAFERFYPAAAGAGWLAMDDLDLHGGFGGALALTTWYERDPLTLTSGSSRLTLISDATFVDLAASATYDRFRLYIDFPMPLAAAGSSGTLAGIAFAAPAVTLGTNPDSIPDVRLGADARLLGAPGGFFRLGLGAQLYVPSASTVDTPATYLTDGTVRAMFRALFAGDVGLYRYAAQVGVHVRPRDDWPTPGGPDGDELLFGAAAGRSFTPLRGWVLIVGPEVYGATALRSAFGGGTTAVEGLITARFEGTGSGAQTRFKLGAGGGLDPQFGAPAFRVVLSVELFNGPR